ncbi:polysaccharide deacetylase family protein [Peribacillus glennii]|uniref:Polysaccharide deacetylase family protein n=1 Tax=Peribacillus glennii TaxID=2303991 RepID=A0A372LB10_9BACI|nr:polysaccharide deacetylase family protein [Peribacillus glennii]RFU62969.1 polysaccharide deacetylase family protein [Peribacillus glennii]
MVNSKPKFVSLTFDDGPSPYTNQILDILGTYNIKATFFVVGEAVKNYPEIVKRINSQNHVIGNHTWNHPVITDIPAKELSSQIQKTSLVIKDIIGEEPIIFRAPYGKIDDHSFRVIQDSGMKSVLWTVDSLDWSLPEKKLIESRVLKNTMTDSIVLLHDGDKFGSGPRDATVHSIPNIIESLMQSGYFFLTIPEFHKQCFTIEKW